MARIRHYITRQWRETLKVNGIYSVKDTGIEDYHSLGVSEDLHAKIWKRSARVLHNEAVKELQELDCFLRLRKMFGAYTISGEGSVGYPNLVWRIGRPSQSNDVAHYIGIHGFGI